MVDTWYGPTRGGREKRYREVCTRMAARGHDVHVFTLKFWDSDAPKILMDGVTIHGVREARVPRFVNGRRSIMFATDFARSVLPFLKRFDFDLVDCDEIPFLHAYPVKIWSVLRNRPMVMGWWETWGESWGKYLGGLKGKVARVIERFTATLPWWLLVESESNMRVLTSWGIDAERISIIPSGVDKVRISRIPPVDHGVDVIFVGRLVRQKGVERLIPLVAYLRETGRPIRLGIVGDGPEAEHLRAQCREAGLEDHVKFFGPIEDDDAVTGLMKGARAFLYPAAMEGGWSVAALEAQACGLPVVTVRSGSLGVCECVIDGENGLLADAECVEALAERVALILCDKELHTRLAQGALRFADRLDWSEQALKVEHVYRRALTSWRSRK